MSNPANENSELDDAWAPGSPLELHSLPFPPVESHSFNIPWHPKITGLRLLTVATTIGLGTAKAATTYRGETVAPVTIEWVMTIVVLLIFLLLGALETREHAWPKWFFQFDWMNLVWAFFRLLSLRPPKYQSGEADTNLLFKPRNPPLTGYRLLVTLSVVGLGTLKAGLSYRGKSTEPTTVEWVLGVVITVALYYLGLYETSSTRVLPSLFEHNYTKHALYTVTALSLLIVYSIGMLFSCGWAYLWGNGIHDMWFGPPKEGLPESTPIELILSKFVSVFWTLMAAVMGVGSGVGGALMLNYWLVVLSAPTIRKVYGWASLKVTTWFVAGSEAQEDGDKTGLLEWLSSHLPSTEFLEDPPLWLKVIYYIVIGFLAVVGYMLVHGVALVAVAGWTGVWGYGLYEIWKGISETQWYMWGFVVVWSLGAGAAIGAGVIGILYILAAFFSPLTGSHMWLS